MEGNKQPEIDETNKHLVIRRAKMDDYAAVCKSRLVAFIQDIVTLPECRGKGIAAKLMKKAREQALNEGAESQELCVWNFNEEAIGLYKKMGMQVQYYRMEERLNL